MYAKGFLIQSNQQFQSVNHTEQSQWLCYECLKLLRKKSKSIEIIFKDEQSKFFIERGHPLKQFYKQLCGMISDIKELFVVVPVVSQATGRLDICVQVFCL